MLRLKVEVGQNLRIARVKCKLTSVLGQNIIHVSAFNLVVIATFKLLTVSSINLNVLHYNDNLKSVNYNHKEN